jgi:hypothetical protein
VGSLDNGMRAGLRHAEVKMDGEPAACLLASW